MGQVGGLPSLPTGMEWPIGVAEYDKEPLAFVASIDLGLLPRCVLDIPLPESGTLLFFYADGQASNTEGWEEEPPYGPAGCSTCPRER
ncbi:uncharacterized protein DUF1963 [Streptomyces sp. BK340]|nr:uncharacterized protein DUF1963 [Streptomyces sp. BK340]